MLSVYPRAPTGRSGWPSPWTSPALATLRPNSAADRSAAVLHVGPHGQAGRAATASRAADAATVMLRMIFMMAPSRSSRDEDRDVRRARLEGRPAGKVEDGDRIARRLGDVQRRAHEPHVVGIVE